MDVGNGEDKAYLSLKLSELQRVGTLGMGGFGRVELVSCKYSVHVFRNLVLLGIFSTTFVLHVNSSAYHCRVRPTATCAHEIANSNVRIFKYVLYSCFDISRLQGAWIIQIYGRSVGDIMEDNLVYP